MPDNKLYKAAILSLMILIILGRAAAPAIIVHSTGNTNDVKAEIEKKIKERAEESVSRLQAFLNTYGYKEISFCGSKVWLVSVKIADNTGMKDTDGDGLFDKEEQSLGTDPGNIDTDGDCLPDGVEAGYALMFGTDKLVVAGKGEYILIIYRYIPDPKKSSIYFPYEDVTIDYREDRTITPLKHVLNPLKPDTDGDGLSDKDELSTFSTIYKEVLYPTILMGLGPDPDELYGMTEDVAENSYKTDIYDPLVSCLPSEWDKGVNVLQLQCTDEDLEGHFLAIQQSEIEGTLPIVQIIRAAPSYAISMDQATDMGYRSIYSNPTAEDTDGDGLTDGEEAKAHSLPSMKDSDNDGLNDYLEVKLYGSSPVSGDSDGDGLDDYSEDVVYGSDPLSPDSDGDRLSDYEEVYLHHTDPLNPDTDGDGLTDYTEVTTSIRGHFLSPFKPDTDGDGLTDFYELKYETDVNGSDTDGDNLTDYEEVEVYHTNPLVADSDEDWLSDWKEVYVYHSDPLNPDTDGDGLTDGEEINPVWSCKIYDYINNKYVPRTAFSSDPTKVDTDGDGWDDFKEARVCTNAEKTDTDNDGLPDPQDPYPYSSDADGDGLSDSDELNKGTNVFDPDTDHDGISDLYDNTLDVNSGQVQQEEDSDKEKAVKEQPHPRLVIKVLDASGMQCVQKHSHFLLCKGAFSGVRKGFTVNITLNVTYIEGNETYRGKRINSIETLLHEPVSGYVKDGVYVINYTINDIIPMPGRSFSYYLTLDAYLSNGEYSIDKSIDIKLVINNTSKPRVKASYKWIKVGGKLTDTGLLFVECDSCSSLKIRAPGLLLNKANQTLSMNWGKAYSRTIAIGMTAVPPLTETGNASAVVTVADVKYYGGEEKGVLPMAKAAADLAKSGQEVGYYLAQLSLAKSGKAKLIYGALAAYNVIDNVIGGLQIYHQFTKAGEEAAEEAGEEAAKENPYVKGFVDFVKDATVDTIKESLDEYAKYLEKQATIHPETYKVVITACNSFGCTTISVDVEGAGYE